MSSGFSVDFENTPFLQTSRVGAELQRLNWRCEVLLTRNQEAIKEKRILDLASHDGRFSYACLKLGARHVSGVEGREHLVKHAIDNLSGLGYTQEQFSFIQDDVFNYIVNVKPGEFDTILCLGLFDHTIRQVELVREIKRIQPACLILDMFIESGIFVKPIQWLKRILRVRFQHLTQVSETMEKLKGTTNIVKGRPCLVYRSENHEDEAATIDPIGIAAMPTESFLELIFIRYGFNLVRLKWDKKEITDNATVRDYLYGTRASYVVQPIGY